MNMKNILVNKLKSLLLYKEIFDTRLKDTKLSTSVALTKDNAFQGGLFKASRDVIIEIMCIVDLIENELKTPLNEVLEEDVVTKIETLKHENVKILEIRNGEIVFTEEVEKFFTNLN